MMTRSVKHFKVLCQIYSRNCKSLNRFTYSSTFLRLGGIGLLTAMVAACSSGPQRTQMPISQEVALYKSHARSYYAPPGPPDDPWGPYIREASTRFDVPEEWIRAVMNQESGGRLFHNGQLVTSGPGAMGLMQLMPPTYDEMRAAYNLGDDAYEPHDNIMAGTAYIRQMYDIYGSPGFLAAYNGGPGRLDDFLTRNRTLPLETRRYVASIGRQIRGISPRNRSQADLLVASHESGGGGIGGGVSYAGLQPTTQATSVQQAWNNRANGQVSSEADRLNGSSLNNIDNMQTDRLNNYVLQSKGQATQVAMAPVDSSTSYSTTASYASNWKSYNRQPAASSALPERQQVSAAWANRGFAPTPVQRQQPVIRRQQMPAPVASPSFTMPAATTSTRNNYYQAIDYHLSPPKARNANITKERVTTGTASRGQWSIQVGAFNSSAQANTAAGQAKSKAAAGSQSVQMVMSGRNKLYRARVVGLSREAAENACQKLGRSGKACMLLPPSMNRS